MRSTRDSVLALSLIVAMPLASTLAVCGCNSDGTEILPSGKSSTPRPTLIPPTVTRKLVAGPLLPSSPGNLLLDPTFGQLTSQDASYGSFLAYYSDGNGTFTPTTTLDSRSPAGFSGNVAIMTAAAATDTKSRGIVMLASVLGGPGPYHASMWVSKSDAAGAPIAFTPDPDAITLSLATDFADGIASANAKAYPLVADATPTVASNGRTWLHYQVDVTDPLPLGAFMLVEIGTKGGGVELAAPAVTSAALEKTLGTQAFVRREPRALRDDERAIIRRYKATPPLYRKPAARSIRGE